MRGRSMWLRDKGKLLAAVSLGALMACQGAARADDTAAEIRLLKERLKQLEAKVAEQSKKEKALAASVARGGPPPLVCKDGPCEPVPVPPPVWVSFKNGLEVQSYEKDFSFRVGGRLHIDGGISSQPETGLSGSTFLRRARVSVEGKAYKYWLYRLEYDFAGSATTATPGGATTAVVGGIRDAYLAFRHPDLAPLPLTKEPIVIQLGNYKNPFGLEQLNSANYMPFIERALATDAFTPSRHIGISARAFGEDWSAKAGVFSTSPEDTSLNPFPQTPPPPNGTIPNPGAATGGGQYVDVTGRVTWAPIHTDEALLHFGGAGRFHKPNSSTGTATVGGAGTGGNDNRVMLLGLNTNSEANVLRENLIGTPDLSCGPIFPFAGAAANQAIAGRCVSSVVTYGAELAASYGPFNFQGEYFGSHYARNAGALAVARRATSGAGANSQGGTSLNFNGFYVSGMWFLTGESRAATYSTGEMGGAVIGEIKILDPVSKGGLGAWELVGRYDQIDLNDGGIQGGRQANVTVGINWYPDRGIRLMADWINVVSLSAPYNRPYLNNNHPNIFLARAMVYW